MDSAIRTVEPARPEHIPLLPRIERSTACQFPPGTIPEEHRFSTVPLAAFREAQEEGRLWTAMEPFVDMPVGFALLGIYGEIAVLDEIDVLPLYWGKGHGGRLVERVALDAAERGFTRLYITTFRNVPWNAPWFARRGFTPVADADAPRAVMDMLRGERARGFHDRTAMVRELGSIP